MPAYTVRWTIQVDAETPEDAARFAANITRDPTSDAISFEVAPEEDEDDPTVEWTTIQIPWP